MLKRIVIGALLIVGLGYVSWRFFLRTTPLDEMYAMQAQLDREGDARPSREERRALYERMETTYDQMTPQQRQSWNLYQESDSRFEKEVNAFFALPPEQRVAHIDERIDMMQEMRAQWEERRAAGEGRDRDRGNRGDDGSRGGDGGGGGGGRALGWRGRPRRRWEPRRRWGGRTRVVARDDDPRATCFAPARCARWVESA